MTLIIATLWVLSPIDLLPEFLPIIGPLDDVVAVVLLLRYAAQAIPPRRPAHRLAGRATAARTTAAHRQLMRGLLVGWRHVPSWHPILTPS